MRYIHVQSSSQLLQLKQGNKVLQEYLISTAKNGLGEQQGSYKTPRGWHRVYQKMGSDAGLNAVFVSRQLTGEVYSDDLSQQFPDRDWILSRILWLEGLEPGKNLGGVCDTRSRYIYIHGTPDSAALGRPVSHGCIRMAPQDVASLFDYIDVHCKVLIE